MGLALGFAFQEIASNFVSGVIISFRKPYQIGDIIKIQSYEGSVKAIDLRYTTMTTFKGLEVIIPNKNMMTEILTNYTTTPDRRVELSIGVAYDSDRKSRTRDKKRC
ncbi:MAG: mechanosensitive ion channel [Bdellovibrionota bacterium]